MSGLVNDIGSKSGTVGVGSTINYEEGTYTPTVSTATGTPAFTVRFGHFVITGNHAMVRAEWRFDGTRTSGQIYTSLPVLPQTLSGSTYGSYVGVYGRENNSTGHGLTGFWDSSRNQIGIKRVHDNSNVSSDNQYQYTVFMHYITDLNAV